MTDNNYPSEKRATRILAIAYPNADAEVRENLAYLVSARRCTIDQALQIMKERMGATSGDAPSETAAAILSLSATSRSTPQPTPATPVSAIFADRSARPAPQKTPPTAKSSAAPTANTEKARRDSDGCRNTTERPSHASEGTAQRPVSSSAKAVHARTGREIDEEFHFPSVDAARPGQRPSATPAPTTPTRYRVPVRARQGSDLSMVSEARPVSPSAAGLKHFLYGDDVAAFNEQVLSQTGQVILFTTSMTGSRSIRDHSRQMETLLYIKRVPYHYVDIADNIHMQRLVREWHQRNTRKFLMPTMPLLFVDANLIGNYEEVQEMENDDTLDTKLRRAGYVAEEDVPEKPDYFAKERAALIAENGVQDGGPQLGSPAPLSDTQGPSSSTSSMPRPKLRKEVVLQPLPKAAPAAAASGDGASTSAKPQRDGAVATGSGGTRQAAGASLIGKPSTLVTLPRPSASGAHARDGKPTGDSKGSGDALASSVPTTPKQRSAVRTAGDSAQPALNGTHACGSQEAAHKGPLQHQRLPHINTTTTLSTTPSAGRHVPTIATTRAPAPNGGGLNLAERPPAAVLRHTAPAPTSASTPAPAPARPTHTAVAHPSTSASATKTMAPAPPTAESSTHPPAPRAQNSFLQMKRAAPPGPAHPAKTASTAAAAASS